MDKNTKILIYTIMTAARSIREYLASDIVYPKQILANLKGTGTLLDSLAKRFVIDYDEKVKNTAGNRLYGILWKRPSIKNDFVLDESEGALLMMIDCCEEYIRTNLPLNKEIPAPIRTELKKCCTRLSKFLNYVNEELTK